ESEGKTAEKHLAKRTCSSSIRRLQHFMKGFHAAFSKAVASEPTLSYRRAPQKFCQEFLNRAILGRPFKVEYDLFDFVTLKQLLDTMMLNSPAERAATHDPSIDMERPSFFPACYDSNFPERTILVTIGSHH